MKSTIERVKFMDFYVQSNLKKIDLAKSPVIINTINPHSYCISKKDKIFFDALLSSDILLPDGIGVVLSIRFLSGVKINRIAGADLHHHLLKLMNQTNGRVFYLGSTQTTLNKIKLRISKEYSNIVFEAYSPPYKSIFSNEDNQTIIELVNAFKPDVLFIGMTAPKQEKWAFQQKQHLNANIIASIGAVFDFYAGTIERPGIFWQSIGLEWLLRFINEPRRLWRRTLISTPCFLWDVIKKKMIH